MKFSTSLFLFAAIVTSTSFTVTVSAIPNSIIETHHPTSTGNLYSLERRSTGSDNFAHVSLHVFHRNDLNQRSINIEETPFAQMLNRLAAMDHHNPRQYEGMWKWAFRGRSEGEPPTQYQEDVYSLMDYIQALPVGDPARDKMDRGEVVHISDLVGN
ncbi:hypothetical protein BC835DRAFT_1523581 [Cytidiella melzeri]|nr:hypothetical protein BC835DRAFT_1523581 [Cytidiella melzeri]